MSRICNKNSNSLKDSKKFHQKEWKRGIPSRKEKKIDYSVCSSPAFVIGCSRNHIQREEDTEKERWMVTPSSPGTSERLKERKKEGEGWRRAAGVVTTETTFSPQPSPNGPTWTMYVLRQPAFVWVWIYAHMCSPPLAPCVCVCVCVCVCGWWL